MKRKTAATAISRVDPERVADAPRAIDFCRTILALDRSLDARLQDAGLNRLDFGMLLDLYITEYAGASLCLWDVCQAASAPLSTAYRHLSDMRDRGFVDHVGPTGDWRRVIVRCSAETKLFLGSLAFAVDSHRAHFAAARPSQAPAGPDLAVAEQGV